MIGPGLRGLVCLAIDRRNVCVASDISNDEPLRERKQAVEADNPAAYVGAVRADIAEVLHQHDDDLDDVYDRKLRSYYLSGGDGLTPREWLTQMAELLAKAADSRKDHRSGSFS